ncbi:ankyrin repeat-containing domain protein [Xylaria castorea]|nr:ankyrin repeat-containing domain protein [Xylaria castorea]
MDIMASTKESAMTAIFDITHECLDLFDRVAVKHDESILTRSFVPCDVGSSPKAENNKHSSRDFIGLRNSFSFWIDYTGALSLMDSSLDTRLRGLTDISAMVIEFLDMILRNLQRLDGLSPTILVRPIDQANPDPAELQAAIMRWEDASRAIDSALNRLHFLAAAIRKASAKQLEYNVATFLSEDDILFHKDAVSLVRWRFPAARKGLCQQLGDSIAVRRRMLLQKHRHAKKLTVRWVPDKGPVAQQERNVEAELGKVATVSPEKRMVHHLNIPTSGITKASRPDPDAPELRQIHLPRRPALTTLISTISTSQGDSFEYPPRPRANLGESRVQCPYCLMPLDNIKLQNRGDEYWRHHVDEDLKPYSCLFPECAEALLFFTRRKEWKSHMELVHSRDWPRKVHTVIWYCDIDHDTPERFEAEWEWRKHMKDPASHAKRKLPAPSKAQLDALSPRKKQVALRDRFVCPLCEQIPDKIRPVVEKVKEQMPDMQEFLFEHIASHIKSLSLMSVPCLDIATPPPEESEQSVSMKDSFKRSLNQGSVPKPPSGIEHLDEVSLPSIAWSTPGRGSLAPPITPNLGATWDTEYSDYKHPDIPPEQSEDEWLEVWTTWKEGNDGVSHGSPESDPILAYLMNAKRADSESRINLQTPNLWLSDFDVKDDSGWTKLSLAAVRGDIDLVKALLNSGAYIEATDQLYGRTPLIWAAENGHEETVKLLLDSGAYVEATDYRYGRTPLIWAAKNGHEKIVKLLLDSSAYIEATDQQFGQTPLIWAAENRHEKIVKLLLDSGAHIEATNRRGQTPLLWAANHEHEKIVKLLLDSGAHTEATNRRGQTPLLWAANHGHEKTVKLLLNRGACIEATDRYGQTPLIWAAENGHTSVVNTLVNHGANIEAVDGIHGQTPISIAAKNGQSDVVKLLIEKGANIRAADRDGRTAHSWATEKGHEAIVELLQSDCDKSSQTQTSDIALH